MWSMVCRWPQSQEGDWARPRTDSTPQHRSQLRRRRKDASRVPNQVSGQKISIFSGLLKTYDAKKSAPFWYQFRRGTIMLIAKQDTVMPMWHSLSYIICDKTHNSITAMFSYCAHISASQLTCWTVSFFRTAKAKIQDFFRTKSQFQDFYRPEPPLIFRTFQTLQDT